MRKRIHTRLGSALRDWTTWASGIVAGALASVSPLLDEPWARRLQIAAVVLVPIGALIKGPQPKGGDDAGNS